MLSKIEFLKKHGLSEDDLNNSGYTWDQLEQIALKHEFLKPELERDASYIAQTIREATDIQNIVHSVRHRIKTSESIIAKIIRKATNSDHPNVETWRKITPDNYLDLICDVIGIRVLHLLQQDWDNLFDFITTNFDIVKSEVYCKSDEQDLFSSRTVNYTQKPNISYRSVHYDAIFTKNSSFKFTFEIQTRTISQEAWGEIDHRFRYPLNETNSILTPYLDIHSNLSNILDRMSSYITTLTRYMEQRNSEINQLRSRIENSAVNESDKDLMIQSLSKIQGEGFSDPFAKIFFPDINFLMTTQFQEVFAAALNNPDELNNLLIGGLSDGTIPQIFLTEINGEQKIDSDKADV